MRDLFVNIKTWRGERRQALELALMPTPSATDCGSVERAQSTANACAEAVGKLLAVLVERHILTLDEAAELAGTSAELTLVD